MLTTRSFSRTQGHVDQQKITTPREPGATARREPRRKEDIATKQRHIAHQTEERDALHTGQSHDSTMPTTSTHPATRSRQKRSTDDHPALASPGTTTGNIFQRYYTPHTDPRTGRAPTPRPDANPRARHRPRHKEGNGSTNEPAGHNQMQPGDTLQQGRSTHGFTYINQEYLKALATDSTSAPGSP